MASTAILGGGISGLTAAYFLKKAGIPFTLFEASNHIGGKIKTTQSDGYLIEHGPNSLQSTTPLLNQIIEETSLSTHQIFAHDRAKQRFVVRQGVPTPLPMTPPALLKSSFFSLKSKLGLLKEPLISAHQNPAQESVADFVKRRLGQEFLDYAVDPFVTGIFAGNPAELSLKHAFPSLYNIEREHGSVLKGLLANRKKNHGKNNKEKEALPRRIFSFRDGMQMLPDGIAETFRDHIKLATKVVDITPQEDHWLIQTTSAETDETHKFDAVLSTLPLPDLKHCATSIQFNIDPLWQVSYPPVTVLSLGFSKEDVSHPLDGFGMLVPGKEAGLRILGTIFSSTVFPNRAPADCVLLTTLIGGARKADFCNLPDELLLDFVLDDLHQLLDVHGNPTFIQKIEWPAAIPQYNLSYGQVKQTINDVEKQHRGLFFAGNYRNGISVGDAVKSGHMAAQRMIQNFDSY